MADTTNQTTNNQVMDNDQWDTFVRGTIWPFMMNNNLERMMVDDGNGKKGVIRRNAAGEYKVQITSNDTL